MMGLLFCQILYRNSPIVHFVTFSELHTGYAFDEAIKLQLAVVLLGQ